MAQRIKGQEVEVIMLVDGVPQDTITNVKSFEITLDGEILSEGYLGETTDQKDSIFNGISGKMDMHISDAAIFDLFSAIVDKARRRTPGTRINIKASLSFPSGVRKRIIIPAVEFGSIPLSFGSRKDYGSTSFTFGASNASFI